MTAKGANKFWNGLALEKRTVLLADVFVSESDKDYSSGTPVPVFLSLNWQKLPGYVKWIVAEKFRGTWKPR